MSIVNIVESILKSALSKEIEASPIAVFSADADTSEEKKQNNEFICDNTGGPKYKMINQILPHILCLPNCDAKNVAFLKLQQQYVWK